MKIHSKSSVSQSTIRLEGFHQVHLENMFTKEAFLSKGISESDESGKAEFINDICNHEKKTANARLYSVIDIKGKQEAIDSSGFTQEFHGRRDNFDISTFPKNIHQNDQFELTQFDKNQEMEEIKDRDFKWCDSLFDTYQNKIFENVLNDPELFLQDHVNKSWENITTPIDSSELISSIVLDNFESHENIPHNVSDCDLKWNAEPKIDSSLTSQLCEDNCGSSVFNLNDATAVQMCGDIINCPKEYFELQPSMICEDYTVSESKMSEGDSKLSDNNSNNLPSLSDLPETQSEVLEAAAAEVRPVQKKKRKNETEMGSDKKRRVTKRRKSKNCSEMLDVYDHSQEITSDKSLLITSADENLKKHCGAKVIINNMLCRQEKIPSRVVLDGPMLSDHIPQNKLKIKNERNKSKRPRRKRKNKFQDCKFEEGYYDSEKHNLFDEDLNTKQDNRRDWQFNRKQTKNSEENCDQNTLSSTENLSLKSSNIIFKDKTNSLSEDTTQQSLESMNCGTDNVSKSIVKNSPLRMKINLLKKEVVYCGYKAKKSNLRRNGKRKYKRKNQINEDTQLAGSNVQNNDYLVPQCHKSTKQQHLSASKRKNHKGNNKTSKVVKINSLNAKMVSPCNGYSVMSNERIESICKSLDLSNYDTDITTTPTLSKYENINKIVEQSNLSYVLTSEPVSDDCVLTYSDVLNLDVPETEDHTDDDNEIECCEKSVICDNDSSKFIDFSSDSSETFSVCDLSFEESDKVNSDSSLLLREENSGIGWSNVNSSELLLESEALETAVKELHHSATMLKDVKGKLEPKDVVIKSLTGQIERFPSNRLYEILEHVISEVQQARFDEMSSASAIVRILMSYAEEKNL